MGVQEGTPSTQKIETRAREGRETVCFVVIVALFCHRGNSVDSL